MVADAQPLFAEALGAALAMDGRFAVLDRRPVSGQEAVDAAAALAPDAALVDYWIEGMDGHDAAAGIVAAHPGCRVLILSWVVAPVHVAKSLSAGASGFLPKSMLVSEVAAAMQRALAGEVPVNAAGLRAMMERLEGRSEATGSVARRFEALTAKELDVLLLLGLGKPLDQIARELRVARGTLKAHMHSILAKTGARSHVEALSLARFAGVIGP